MSHGFEFVLKGQELVIHTQGCFSTKSMMHTNNG